MFKVSSNLQHDSSSSLKTTYSLSRCLREMSADHYICHAGCAQQHKYPMDTDKVVDLSRLNQLALAFAWEGQYCDSMKCFEAAFALLFQLGLNQSDIRSMESTKLIDPMVAAVEDYFDERVEYDEGWCLFDLSSSSISLDSFGAAATAHEYASAILYNVGQVQLLQRRYSVAKDVFVNAFVLARSVATKHSHLLSVPILHRIGYLQYWQREIHSAIETYHIALNECENCPDLLLRVASTLNCLGVLYFHLPEPEPEKSREYLLRALALQRKALGCEDTAIATTLNNLGRVHFTAERLDLALDAYEEALCMRRKILGVEHVDVAATVYNCGQTLQRLGKFHLALERYKEFVRISLVLGRPNRYLIVALKCMANIYQEQREFSEALKYYSQALTMGKQILGVHAEIAALYNKLGNLLYQMGDSNAAISMYEQGLAVERVVLHPYHPNIAVTLCNLAQIHKQRGEFRVSLQLYEEALSLQRKSVAQPDSGSAVTISNIGLIYYQTRRYGQALEKFQEALRIRRDVLGEYNLDVASCLNSLGLVLFKLGLPELALQRFIESLTIRRDVQGDSHRDVATILHNIATIHLELANDEDGIRCYQESLRIERMALGPLHDDILSTLECLGKVHQFRGELVSALGCFREVLEIRRRRLSKDDASIARTLNLVASICLQVGDVAGCMDAMSEAMRIARNSQALHEDEVELFGFELYGFSKLHPEAAAAA